MRVPFGQSRDTKLGSHVIRTPLQLRVEHSLDDLSHCIDGRPGIVGCVHTLRGLVVDEDTSAGHEHLVHSQSTYPRIRKKKRKKIAAYPYGILVSSAVSAIYLRSGHGTKPPGLTFDDNLASSGV